MHQEENDDRKFNIRLFFAQDYTAITVLVESNDVIDENDFRWVMKKLSKLELKETTGNDGLQ